MTTVIKEKERDQKASLALHKILTHLWDFKNNVKWDGETWILFHNLLILLSMRNKLNHDDWALEIFCWTGGIIPTLEQKGKTDTLLLSDPGLVLYDYMSLANWTFDVHPNDEDEGVVRIVKAYREQRNIHLKKLGGVFAYLLAETEIETSEAYCEPDLQNFARRALEMTSEIMSAKHKVENLQFEVSKDITISDIERHLLDYFNKEGLRTKPFVMGTGSVYNDQDKIVFNISITVECGWKHSIVLITLTSEF